MTQPACPEPSRWSAFLAGGLPDAETAALNEHLEDCDACRTALDRVVLDGGPWSVLAGPASADSALALALNRLKARAAGAGSSSAADIPPGFFGPPLQVGHVGRLGRYDVVEQLGRGCMGIVFKAFHSELHCVHAIKVLAPQLAASAAARERFAREARAVASVTSEHVVTIFDVADKDTLLPYFVMEHVPGESLQQKLDREGTLGLKEVLRIGMQVAAGLAAAHAQGLVHRDIKPANILLVNGVDRLKITDFGLARAIDDASLTQSGFIAGTPQYMAPEQADGGRADHRSDLFSLGCVLYALCTGHPPFRAETARAVLKRVCEETPRPIRDSNPEWPDWLEIILARLLAKNPSARYQTAAEVNEALEQGLKRLQAPPAPVVPESAAPTPAPSTIQDQGNPLPVASPSGGILPRALQGTRTIGQWTAVLALLGTLCFLVIGIIKFVSTKAENAVASWRSNWECSKGNDCLQNKDYDQAITRYTEALRLDPSNAKAKLNCANAYHQRGSSRYDKGEYDKAIADLKEVINIYPRDPKNPEDPLPGTTNHFVHDSYVLVGRATVEKGDPGMAILWLGMAIDVYPHSSKLHVNRGNAYRLTGANDQAIADYTRGLEFFSAPVQSLPYVGGNRQHFLGYEGERARILWTRDESERARILWGRGQAWAAKEDYDKAITDATEAIRIDGKFAPVLYLRGDAYLAKGEWDKAITDYTEFIRLDSQNADAYYHRGSAWFAKGAYDIAIADYNEAIRLDSKNAATWFSRGVAWAKSKEYDKAVADYTEAIRLDPQDASAYSNRGNCRSHKEDWDKAIADYTEAIRLDPQKAKAFRNRGLAWQAKGNMEKAEADFKEAKRLEK
jgi:serine/threonine protein kinase/regulator of sirC expression with transglutaminase-like and TPR domain